MAAALELRARVEEALARLNLKGEPRLVEAWLRVAHTPEQLLEMDNERFAAWLDVAHGCLLAEGREAAEKLAAQKGVAP